MKRKKLHINKKIIFSFILTVIIFQLIIMGKNEKDIENLQNKIEKPLSDNSIKEGVVVNNEKDKKDITFKNFDKIKKQNKKINKNSKYPYYTLEDIGKARDTFKTVITPMPPNGLNVDNINQIPNPANQNLLNVPFKDYVVFYPQHQDDEVLWAGSAIRTAINERGADHVFVALVSSGTGHKIFKSKEFQGMDLKEKANFRNREFLSSCLHLGIPKKNIFFLYKNREDWKTDFNLEREFALKMEKKYKSVTHITHSYKYDDHFMHRANGETLYRMWKKGEISDLRFFIKPFLLKYVDATKNTLNIYTVNSKSDYDKIKEACKSYKYINIDRGRFGIGYKTDYMSFDKLVYDRNERSYIIIQNNKLKG